MKHKFLLRGVKRVMSSNRALMLMVLFWIIEELIEDTETDVDGNTKNSLESILGVEADTSELRNI